MRLLTRPGGAVENGKSEQRKRLATVRRTLLAAARTIVRISCVCVLAFGLTGTAKAEPLNPKQISAEAKWLIHFDFDAMRGSVALTQGVEKHKDKLKTILETIDEIRSSREAFDLAALKGVTFYGMQFAGCAGVAVIQSKSAEPVITRAIENARQAPDYATTQHNSHELHTWTHGKGTDCQCSITAAYVKPNRVILGTSTEEVAAALDVLDGKRPSLRSKSSPLAAQLPVGTLVVARAEGLPDVDLPLKLPMLKRTEAVSLVLGETPGEGYIESELTAKNPEIAEEVRKAVDDAIVAALLATDDYDLADMLNAATIKVNEKVVTVSVRGAADSGWMYLEKAATKLVEEWRKRSQQQRQTESK